MRKKALYLIPITISALGAVFFFLKKQEEKEKIEMKEIQPLEREKIEVSSIKSKTRKVKKKKSTGIWRLADIRLYDEKNDDFITINTPRNNNTFLLVLLLKDGKSILEFHKIADDKTFQILLPNQLILKYSLAQLIGRKFDPWSQKIK